MYHENSHMLRHHVIFLNIRQVTREIAKLYKVQFHLTFFYIIISIKQTQKGKEKRRNKMDNAVVTQNWKGWLKGDFFWTGCLWSDWRKQVIGSNLIHKVSKYIGFISHIHLLVSPKGTFDNGILRPTENGLDGGMARWMCKASDRKSERSSYFGELSTLLCSTLHQEQVLFFGCFWKLFLVSPERTSALYFSAQLTHVTSRARRCFLSR